ncbi:hypothetical protein ACFVS2_20670 [Brevibacillus sp. NPDC058079]|uniref:hypothetical protein n=1 Tax=Brevibacillus sp. NPDC058079 TaxID=3346330 RepID=UPI0036E18023
MKNNFFEERQAQVANDEQKTYHIPVTWEMRGVISVNAFSFDEAVKLVRDANLPTDWEYVDGSKEVNEELFLSYNKPYQVAVKSFSSNRDWYSLLIGRIFTVIDLSKDKTNFIVEHDGERKELRMKDALILNVA